MWASINGQLPQVLHVFPKPSQSHGTSKHLEGLVIVVSLDVVLLPKRGLLCTSSTVLVVLLLMEPLTLCFSMDLKSHCKNRTQKVGHQQNELQNQNSKALEPTALSPVFSFTTAALISDKGSCTVNQERKLKMKRFCNTRGSCKCNRKFESDARL